jgi:hypothetical protein
MEPVIYDNKPMFKCEKCHLTICQHFGNNPRGFQCIDCEDDAEECNCYDCMGGVFCNACQTIVPATCDDVREAYRQKEEKE